jgi:hypothetical protein
MNCGVGRTWPNDLHSDRGSTVAGAAFWTFPGMRSKREVCFDFMLAFCELEGWNGSARRPSRGMRLFTRMHNEYTRGVWKKWAR